MIIINTPSLPPLRWFSHWYAIISCMLEFLFSLDYTLPLRFDWSFFFFRLSYFIISFFFVFSSCFFVIIFWLFAFITLCFRWLISLLIAYANMPLATFSVAITPFFAFHMPRLILPLILATLRFHTLLHIAISHCLFLRSADITSPDSRFLLIIALPHWYMILVIVIISADANIHTCHWPHITAGH